MSRVSKMPTERERTASDVGIALAAGVAIGTALYFLYADWQTKKETASGSTCSQRVRWCQETCPQTDVGCVADCRNICDAGAKR